VLHTYWQLMIHRRYIGNVLAGGISLAGLFAYISGSPFVVIELHHVAAEDFGWLFGANALGLVLAAQLNARMVRRHQPETLVLGGLAVQAIAGAFLVVAGATGIGGLYGIAVPLFAYVSCIGIVMPNATALAMAPFPQIAGAASALLGTLQFGLAAVSASLVGAIHDDSAIPMSAVILACGGLSLLIFGALVASRGTAHVVGE
jgi:DHA1 family bicyclomycin/chloramphenicol resistance-like MFS transporter